MSKIENCPKCGSKMTAGISHAEHGCWQLECHHCGYVEVVDNDPS